MVSVVVGRYHLRDIVVGKIYFLLVRIKIKHMEIAIIKKETSGTREFTCRQCRGRGEEGIKHGLSVYLMCICTCESHKPS